MTTLEIVLIIILYLSGGIFGYIKQEIFVDDKDNASPVGVFFIWPIILLYRFIKKVIVDPWN